MWKHSAQLFLHFSSPNLALHNLDVDNSETKFPQLYANRKQTGELAANMAFLFATINSTMQNPSHTSGHRKERYWYEAPRHLQKSNTKCLILAQIHYSHLTVMTKTTSKGSLSKQQVHTRSVYLLPRVSHQDNNSIFFEQLPAPLFFSTGHTSSYWKATDPQMCCVWFAYLNMQITAKRVIFMLHIFAEKLNVQNVYCNNYWFHGISTKGCKSSK